MQFDFKAFLAGGFLMLFGYGIRSLGVKIPGELAILIGFFGIIATISYGKFYTISVITNPYFLLFSISSIFLIISILLYWRKPKSKPALPLPTSKPSEPLSQAEKTMARASEINRLTGLIEKTKNEIAAEQAKGDYLFKLPDLLKKKEQYLKELEELK